MTMRFLSVSLLVFTLSVFFLLNRCQNPVVSASRDFRWLIFLPEVHDQPIIYSIDSLIFIGKPLDAISLAGLSDHIPEGVYQTYLKSRLLEANTMSGMENRELYEDVISQTAVSASVQFVRDYTLEYYNSRFHPDKCDFKKIGILVEKASGPYFRAKAMNLKAFWFKEIKFNMDSSWHWYK